MSIARGGLIGTNALRSLSGSLPRNCFNRVQYAAPTVALASARSERGRVVCNRHFSCSRKFHEAAFETKDAYSTQDLFDLSLKLLQTPMDDDAMTDCTLYGQDGTTLWTKSLSKSDIAAQYDVSTRDLRAIDLSSHGFPQILIRESTLLVDLFRIRLLIQADQVLVLHDKAFDDRGEDNSLQLFTHCLLGRLRENHETAIPTNLPYELRILEAALASALSTLEAKLMLAKKQVSGSLHSLDLRMLDQKEDLIHSQQRLVLDIVRRLAAIEQGARQIRNAIQEVLNNDEDMAAMYLTDKKAGKPHAVLDHQDAEYLFEAYYKASDAIVEQSVTMIQSMRRTEETIQSMLNVRRNQIMVLEAKIEIVMLGLASSTLVAGLYGMNVINYFEESTWAFAALTSLCLVATTVTWRYGLRKLRLIHNWKVKF